MITYHRTLCLRLRQLWALALVCLSAAASAQDAPDAVIVTDPSPQWTCSLFPVLAQLKQPPMLVYSAENKTYLQEYLDQIAARRVWFVDPSHKLPQQWMDKFPKWSEASTVSPLDIIRRYWTDPKELVVVDDRDPGWALAGTLLATARAEPGICLHGEPNEATRDWLRALKKPKLLCLGPVSIGPEDFPDASITNVTSLAQAFDAYEAALHHTPIEHLVVVGSEAGSANPELDNSDWLLTQYAVHHNAAVAIIDRSTSVESQIEQLASTRYPALRYITLWGSTRSLPDEEVDDPVAAAGLDTKLTEPKVAVPPLSGITRQKPCQFRVGRITGDTVSSVSLLVARNLRQPHGRLNEPPTALILANTDSDLPIMEAITRTTAQTLERAGWQVRANYGWQTSWYKRYGRLWGADLVLYEGHTANLAQSVQFDYEREPIESGLYVFQGCKTLRQPEVTALLRNGAVGVIGTTTNTYSASGSALAKVVVDAMVLDHVDAGTSLMVARNFMLALADLKQRRGHEQSPKIIRGGMTFSLWGDPTHRLPQSPRQLSDVEFVRSAVKGKLIELQVPQEFAAPVNVGDYTAQIPIGAKLAGMYEWETEDRTRRQLPPLYFAVVPLPDWKSAQAPQITTPLARNRWTSLWDSRNHWLYLIVQSSTRNEHDRGKKMSFHLDSSE